MFATISCGNTFLWSVRFGKKLLVFSSLPIVLNWFGTKPCIAMNKIVWVTVTRKPDPKKAFRSKFRWLFAVFFFFHTYINAVYLMSKTSTTCLWFSVVEHNAVCQYFTIHITHISKFEFEMWILIRQIWKLYLMSRYFAPSAHDYSIQNFVD